MRTCVACRRVRPRDELVRVVRSPEGAVTIDERGTRPGRGAYVCRDTTCIRTAIAHDARHLRRALRTPDASQVAETLGDLHDQLVTASAS